MEVSLETVKKENFLRELESDRDWRVKEFATIKKVYVTVKTTDFESIYLKMIVPIIYAHWEGFCVTTFKSIISFINSQKLSYADLTTSLFTYAQQNTYDYLKGKQSFEQRCKFTKEFLNILSTNDFTLNTKVNTKSNLKFDVFNEICDVIGIEITPFKNYKDDLNKLVHLRNAIAHGENSIKLDIDIITENIELVTQLMDLFILEACYFINNNKYLESVT
jgi:hypothetical protein